jgi:outer membrane scaffolding protein for murein synthesis (MipA/OmpV family)
METETMGDVGGATHTQMGLIREVDESPGAVKGSTGKKKQVKISEDKAAMDKQMKKIDAEVGVGAFVQYNLKLSQLPFHQLAFSVDGSGANTGALYTAKVIYWQPFSQELVGTFGVGTSFGDNKYMKTYYGVTGSDIALFPSLGGNAYNAKSGLIGVNFPIGLTYIMDRRWMFSGGFRYQKLMDDAKDSPIVSQQGDSSQWIYGLGVSYIF